MVIQERGGQTQHPEGLIPRQEQLALQLFDIGAIRFGDFRLKLHDKNPEAPLSPVYIDLRVLPRNPDVMREVAKVYAELAKEAKPYDVCLGVPEAGNPLATAFSLETGTPQIYLRKEEKIGHGIVGNFMTPINDGEVVLVIDDLVTRADSKLEVIEVLENSGLKANDVIVLLDREQGGETQLADKGYKLHAAFKMGQMLSFYARVGKITQEVYQDVIQRLEALNRFLVVA